jgi:predicted DNA-binding transcriptional regulator YafY
MNRTDRLLAIVLELQAHGVRRAEDLAATFEISKRTVYRDVQALCEAGVPVVAEAGRGYWLAEGYFLPPLRFGADEAVMLLLGADVMAQSFDAEYRAAAEAAARKIAGALTPERRAEVQDLRESIRFVGEAGAADETTLRTLRRAIVARRSVRMRYTARRGPQSAGDETCREADPYALVRSNGAWHLVAHCHTRGALRHFRLDRIDALELLERTFERPPGLHPQRPASEQRPLVVRVLFAPSAARWVREAPSFYTVAEELRDDGLLLTLRVRQEHELIPWLLGWGAQARVLEPASLAAALAETARAIVRQYEQSGEDPAGFLPPSHQATKPT